MQAPGRGATRVVPRCPARLNGVSFEAGEELNLRGGKLILRGDVVVFIVIMATTIIVGLLGFAEIVGPIARAALLLIPTIFAVSLAFGFVSRRQNWFR